MRDLPTIFRKWPDVRKLAAALAFSAGLVAASEAGAQTCNLQQLASLDMLAVDGAIVVPVEVNGTARHFLVDTGGIYSAISQDLSNQLGLVPHKTGVEVFDMAGHKTSSAVTLKSLKLGNNEAHDFHILVKDDPNLVKAGIDGIVAPDLLQVFDVEIDFKNRKLNLFSPVHCPGKVVYWARDYVDLPFSSPDGSHVQIGVRLDGENLTAILDTGSSHSQIDLAAAKRRYTLAPDSLENTGDPLLPYKHTFGSLQFEGVAVSTPTLLFLDQQASQSFRHEHSEKDVNDPIYGFGLEKSDLVLGLNVLSALHLYIAYKERAVYLTAADAH